MTDEGVPAVRSEGGALATGTISCPFCAEQIQPAAKKCRHCGEILDAVMRKQQEVARPVAAGGAAAASSSSTTVVIRDRPRVNHALHIFLCFISFGLWIPIYILVLIGSAMSRD